MPATMKKKECYYRSELEKVDWNKLQAKGARGQTVSNLSQAKKLAETAKEEKLKKGEVKVGLAGKDLVFRIKYKNKVGMDAYFKKDVVLIQDFRKLLTNSGLPTEDPDYVEDGSPEEDEVVDSSEGESTQEQPPTTAMLVLGQPPKLTVAWWRSARGTFPENGMEEALSKFNQYLPLIRTPSNAVFKVLVKLVGDVMKKAAEVESSCGSPTDKQLMANFSQAALKAQDDVIARQTQYGENLEKHSHDILQQMTDNVDKYEESYSQAKKIIEDAIAKDTPTSIELQTARIKLTAVDDYVRKVPIFINLIDKAWNKPKGGIDSKDLIDHKGYHSRVAHANEFVNTMRAGAQDLHRRLSPKVDQFLNGISRTPEYIKELDEIKGIYQEVIRKLSAIIPRAQTAARDAGPVLNSAKTATSLQQATGVMRDADRVCQAIKAIKEEASNDFSSVRAQGEGATKLKASKLTMEEKTFTFGTGMFEDAKKVNLRITDVASAGFLQLEQAMDALQANIPDLGQLAPAVEKLRAEAESYQKPMA